MGVGALHVAALDGRVQTINDVLEQGGDIELRNVVCMTVRSSLIWLYSIYSGLLHTPARAVEMVLCEANRRIRSSG